MDESAIDVSVIVAVRNGAATLAECIDSVLAQQGCQVELIIVDAMSTDGTTEIVESYADGIAKYIREPDEGIFDAWNKALVVARGEWCAFLGSDDHYIGSDAIQSLLDAAHSVSEHRPVFIYGGIRISDGSSHQDTLPLPANPVRSLRRGTMLPHPGALHRSTALRNIGGFNPTFRIAGDLDAVVRMAALGRIAHSSRVVTFHRLGGVSSRTNMARTKRAEVQSIVARESGHRFLARARAIRFLSRAAAAALRLVLGPDRARRTIARVRRLIPKS